MDLEAPVSAAVDTPMPDTSVDTGGGEEFTDAGSAISSFFADNGDEPEPEAEIPAPPVQQAQPEVQEQLDPFSEDEDLDALAKQAGRVKQVPAERFNSILQNHKFAKQVQDFAPTVEAARANYETATDFRRVIADLSSGDPAIVKGVLGYLGEQAPQGITAMATSFPAMLQESNPEAYEEMATGVVLNLVDQAFTRAQDIVDPIERGKAIYAAQLMEWQQTGKYRQPGEAKPVDPLAAREAAIAAKEAQYAQAETQKQEAATKAWTQGTYGAINQGIAKQIDEVLKPVVHSYDPHELRAIRNDILNQLKEAVEKDRDWQQNYDLDFRTGVKLQSDEARAALAQRYVARVKQVIRSVAKPLVDGATRRKVEANKAGHDRSRAAATKVAPGSNGKPNATSASQASKPGMSVAEDIHAFLNAR